MSPKVIFRKIGGRIVPISIRSVKDLDNAALESFVKVRKFIAKAGETRLGHLEASFPKGKRHVNVEAVTIEKPFQKKGIAKQLFLTLDRFAKKAGYKFIRGESIQHPAQVKIRRKFNTRFVRTGFGPYGGETRFVSSSEALRGLVDAHKGIPVLGETKGVTQVGTYPKTRANIVRKLRKLQEKKLKL